MKVGRAYLGDNLQVRLSATPSQLAVVEPFDIKEEIGGYIFSGVQENSSTYSLLPEGWSCPDEKKTLYN